jgi:phosphoglycerate kinase
MIKSVLLENCRFYAGEEQNDQNLARAYASLADIYVNDAFSCSHRSHASIQAITGFLPSYAGPVLAAELTALSDALESPKRPVAAFVGGAKISTKLSVLENLILQSG